VAQTAGSVAKSAGDRSNELEGREQGQQHQGQQHQGQQDGLSGQYQNGLSNGLSKHV
jgi:hypothetical protein